MTSNFAELHPSAEPLGAVSGFVNEFIGAVSPRDLFEDFSRQETALLTEYLECFGVPRNSVVMKDGEEADFLAILVTGGAVVMKGAGEAKRVVEVLCPGQMVGELSLVDGRRRAGSVITTEPSDFGVLTVAGLNALLAEHPRLGNKFLLMLLKRNVARLRDIYQTLPPDILGSAI